MSRIEGFVRYSTSLNQWRIVLKHPKVEELAVCLGLSLTLAGDIQLVFDGKPPADLRAWASYNDEGEAQSRSNRAEVIDYGVVSPLEAAVLHGGLLHGGRVDPTHMMFTDIEVARAVIIGLIDQLRREERANIKAMATLGKIEALCEKGYEREQEGGVDAVPLEGS